MSETLGACRSNLDLLAVPRISAISARGYL
jgi:hypothetical protein